MKDKRNTPKIIKTNNDNNKQNKKDINENITKSFVINGVLFFIIISTNHLYSKL